MVAILVESLFHFLRSDLINESSHQKGLLEAHFVIAVKELKINHIKSGLIKYLLYFYHPAT